MRLFRNARVIGLAGAVLLSSAAAAMALEAASTTALNVRSGPGTSYGVVDVLYDGEVVEITECVSNGWCYIEHDGPDGWVSSNYLTTSEAEEEAESGSDSDCSFGFTIGPGGPQFYIQCGDAPIVTPSPPSPPSPPVPNEACFYDGANYTGSHFCHGVGTLNVLNAAFNDKISSVKLSGSAKAKLCVNTNLGGYCRTVNNDVPVLGLLINNKASSLTVYTGAPPTPPTPVTYSTGTIALQQTYQANLDNGHVGAVGADIWYQAQTPLLKYITPRNGALLARGDGSNRGFAGCSVESFSGNKIPLLTLTPGTYVCVKTSAGRISQFRVNSYSGTTMNIGYTTWAN